MARYQREDRLRSDHETLKTLREQSSIFSFDTGGDPPDRYTLSFRGKGISRDISPHADVEIIELHRIDMRLPFAYPGSPPDLRWVTPILHPNVSFSGFIHLRDVGLPWDDNVTLDVVCERLWDVARLAYVNLAKATNFSAKSWIENQTGLSTPVDPRALRDRTPPSSANVVRYHRRGDQRPELPSTGNEVLFIGEDTPIPPLPTEPRPRRRGDDDDVFYIGDE